MANTWQGEFPRQNLCSDGFQRISPVTAFAPNGYGLHDIIGNVWEWTTDWYSARHQADAPKACCIPENPRGGPEAASLDPCQPNVKIPRKVLKGGSYLCVPELLPPLSPGCAPSRAGRHLHKPRRLQVHQQKSTESERVMSKDQMRGRSENGITQNSEGLKRRDLLLSGTLMFAASALLSAGFATSAEAQQTAATPPTGKQPNILVIMADDVGIWNVSAYHRGMMGGRTPNIDRIAKEGALFTDYYAQQSCTAGRAAFILGQIPFRTGLLKVGLPAAKQGLQDSDPTIAQFLKPLGYATAQIGKIHLGDRNEYLPTVHGFDEFYGILYHLNAIRPRLTR